ncbi:hypothetical protein PTKIN_Ptkin19aG0065700 [Pterospermum kingtungense]
MKFTYVLPDWEGTASDSRILKNALTREDRLIIPQGTGLLTPYRGVRYHLKEYSRRGPENAKELFNHKHASLHNVIKRAFNVLKKRFPIIASGTKPCYSFKTMIEIVLACCILHNFLMGVDPDENLINEVDMELQVEDSNSVGRDGVGTDADSRVGEMIRNNIAQHMWIDYQSH